MSAEYAHGSPDSLLVSFLFEPDRSTGRLALVSGPSGCGKTSLCARLAAGATGRGLALGGLLCPAVFEAGRKVAIDQLDLATGTRKRLAVRTANGGTVGCWRMDESVIAWGNQVLARLHDQDVIILDELGPLELEHGQGYRQAVQLLDEGRYRRALAVVRPALLPLARQRWPGARTFPLEGGAP